MMSFHEMPKSILKKKTSFDGGRSSSGHIQIHPILKRNSLGSEQLTTSLEPSSSSPPSPQRHIKLPIHDPQQSIEQQQHNPIHAAHSQVHPILKKSSSEDDNYSSFYQSNHQHHYHSEEQYWPQHQRSSSSGPKPCLKKRSSFDETSEKKAVEIKPILKRKDTKSEPDFSLKPIIKPLSQSSLPSSTGTIITQEDIEADLLSRDKSRSPSRSWRSNNT